MDGVDGYDVRMLKSREPLSFAGRSQRDFQSDGPPGERFLACQEDARECSLPQFLDEFESDKCVANAQADAAVFLGDTP